MIAPNFNFLSPPPTGVMLVRAGNNSRSDQTLAQLPNPRDPKKTVEADLHSNSDQTKIYSLSDEAIAVARELGFTPGKKGDFAASTRLDLVALPKNDSPEYVLSNYDQANPALARAGTKVVVMRNDAQASVLKPEEVSVEAGDIPTLVYSLPEPLSQNSTLAEFLDRIARKEISANSSIQNGLYRGEFIVASGAKVTLSLDTKSFTGTATYKNDKSKISESLNPAQVKELLPAFIPEQEARQKTKNWLEQQALIVKLAN